LKDPRYPKLPEELIFLHAEEILDMYPDLPRKQRETQILQKYPAIFIIGIGWPLKDGYPHEMRAADSDVWVTNTSGETGCDSHVLNGDILVWNAVTRRRHELSSMGIRVTKETLKTQLEFSHQLDFLQLPYHRALLEDRIPLSIGGSIGQSYADVTSAESAFGRSEHNGVVEDLEGDLREERNLRARVGRCRFEIEVVGT
jgi:aspartate--ammonia ligase